MRSARYIALCFIVGSSVVHAQTATIGDIDQAAGEALKYNAQAQAGEARNKANQVSGGGLPILKEIVSVETDREHSVYAIWVYPGSSGKIEATVGQTLPSGHKVVRILEEQNQVELARGREHFKVGFSGNKSSSQFR